MRQATSSQLYYYPNLNLLSLYKYGLPLTGNLTMLDLSSLLSFNFKLNSRIIYQLNNILTTAALIFTTQRNRIILNSFVKTNKDLVNYNLQEIFHRIPSNGSTQ